MEPRAEGGATSNFGAAPIGAAKKRGYEENDMRTKPERFPQLLTVTFLLAAAAVGAAYGQNKKPKKPADAPQPTTTVKLSAAVPSLAALEDTPQSQAKGGLRITLAPETYEAKETWTDQSRPVSCGRICFQPDPKAVYVEKTKVPSLPISPDHLIFHLHLNNQMSHVFRGSGIAVQINVAGKVVPLDASGYGDLTNMILPPRGEQEVLIVGPEISTIKSPSTVGVFLFDVVTDIDQAGNVTAKQNFEWYFSYQTQTMEKEFSVPAPTQGWVW